MAWSQIYRQNGSDVVKHTFDWTSNSSGNATLASGQSVSGEIKRVVFDPGSAAPTDNYDVTLTDENGIDVLAGQGTDLDTSVTSHVCPGIPLKDGTTTSVAQVAVDGILTLNVSGAGDTKTGKVIVYVR